MLSFHALPAPQPQRPIETDKTDAYAVWGVQQVNLRNMMAVIDTNLDDVQSGVEACTRAAHIIQSDAEAVDQQMSTLIEHADLIGLLVRRAKELQVCARDQSGALRELRQNVALLRAELKLSNSAQRRGGAGDRRRENGKNRDSASSPEPGIVGLRELRR